MSPGLIQFIFGVVNLSAILTCYCLLSTSNKFFFIDTGVQYHNVCVVMYDFVTYTFFPCFLLRPFSGSPGSLFN